MATYAALVSLTNLIDQIQLYHPHKPTFTTEQLLQIQSLQEKAYFLQDFLENGNPPGVLTQQEQEDLERRIADVVYRAEDIIESHVVDDIEARLRQTESYNHLSHLPEVIRFMDSITTEVMMIKKNSRVLYFDHQRKDLVPVGSPRSAAAAKDTTLVFHDKLNEIMVKLIGQGSCLQILPIIGMGGIGKTTLAKHVYDNAYVMEYFDIRGWITVSQAYDTRELLLGLALGIGVHIDDVVINMWKLEEIPLGFADIATLQSILVRKCKKSVVDSAKAIQEEQQQNLGNEDFHLILVDGGVARPL